MEQIGYSLERRRLAGAIGAKQRDNAAARYGQRHPLENEDDAVVNDLDVIERKDGLGYRRSRLRLERRDPGHSPFPRRVRNELTTTYRKVRSASASRHWLSRSPA